jgi:CDP-diacylglycerol--glycerol-3-phosphate 3-phosphatidyltransferase
MFNLPNVLTLSRIALIPVFVGVFYLEWRYSHMLAAGIFAFAAITDWVDGYLARRMGLVTPFGAFLDPVADKLIVTVALIMLVEVHGGLWLAVPAMVIIGREIIISALREWMSTLGSASTVAVSFLGKVKTWAQMIAVVVLLLAREDDWALIALGYVALYVAALLTLGTMISYLQQAWPQLRGGTDQEQPPKAHK